MEIKLCLEDRFILHCLHSKFGQSPSDFPSDIDLSKINWTALYQKSMGLLVAPVIYDYIKNHTDSLNGIVPEEFVTRLEKIYLSLFLDNMKNLEKLSDIIRKFNDKGIETVLLKGAHLLQYVYKDMALRSMGDVDILIKREAFPRAEKIVLNNGYKCWHYNNEMCRLQDVEDRINASGKQHLAYISLNGFKLLEVHWTIKKPAHPFDISMEEIWQNTEERKFEGETIKILSMEDLVLHLCFNTCVDHRVSTHKLKPYCDLAAIISKSADTFNWDETLQKARKWGIEKYLYLFLLLSRELAGAMVPDNVLSELKPSNFHHSILIEAKKRILSPEMNPIRYANELRPEASLAKKVKFILNRLFISRDEIANIYSIDSASILVYYCYLKRFFRLSSEYSSFFLTQMTMGGKEALRENLDLWLLPSQKKNKGFL